MVEETQEVVDTTPVVEKPFKQTDVTLVDIVQEAVIEHAESRTERYELWKDKEKGLLKTDFERACHTTAYLAEQVLPNTEIVLKGKFGQIRRVSPVVYSVPKALGIYEIANFSNRVYFCEIDAENMEYITTINRPFGYDIDKVMSPEEYDSFWKNYESCEKNTSLNMTKLTKADINVSNLPGLVEEDEDFEGGFRFNSFKNDTSGCKVSRTCIEALLLSADKLSGLGRENAMMPLGALVNRIATQASVVSGAGESNDGSDN